MESLPPVEVTRLLARARAGDAQAMGSAYSAVYDELKRAARLQLRRMQDNFETTALVHEAYLKLGGAQLAAEHRLAGSREFVQRFTPSRGVATEWLALARIRRQHRAHFIEQVRIVATAFAPALFARLAVQVDHGIEGCHCPFLAFHRRFVHAAVSFMRNARARRQSRRRVLSLIASMSATSTSV